jgi:transposase
MSRVGKGGRYPDEVRERSVRMVFEYQHEYPSQWKAIESIGEKLDVHRETLRTGSRRAEVDEGRRPGLSSDDRQRLKDLERENKELRRANEILKGGVGFLRAGARPATAEVVHFIDANRDRFGVEPICRVLSEHDPLGRGASPSRTSWGRSSRPR